MRRLILRMSVTIDGFVGGPKGEVDWIFRSLDDGASAWIVDTLWQAGVHIMGSRAFQEMARHWFGASGPMVAPMQQIPKIVFSRLGIRREETHQRRSEVLGLSESGIRRVSSHRATPVVISRDAGLNEPQIVSGDLAEEISHLKGEPGKPIIAHGGARFAQSLLALGLVDEFRLLVHPVALGKGLPLFAGLRKPLLLKLVNTLAFRGGTVAQIYRRSEIGAESVK